MHFESESLEISGVFWFFFKGLLLKILQELIIYKIFFIESLASFLSLHSLYVTGYQHLNFRDPHRDVLEEGWG